MKSKISYFFASLFALLSATPAFAAGSQPENWGTGLLAAASPVREKMIWFYNDLLTPIIVAIVVFVFVLMAFVLVRFNAKANPKPSKTTHNTLLEVMWTLVPVIILIVIVVPSMKILYFADRTHDAEMTLKVTGYQWYWGYEYPDNGGVNFLSNLVKDTELKPDQLRLLSTDNPVVLPVDTNVRILIAASDVIHSWSVPAFGVKLDAIPGRLNETWVRATKTGTFYGQCSQLCGAGHGFMPIEIKVVPRDDFAVWVRAQHGTMPGDAKPAEKQVEKPAEKQAEPKKTNKPGAK